MPSKGQLTTAEKFAAQLLALGKTLTFASEQAGLSLPQLRKRLELPIMQQEIDRWRSQHFASLSESLGTRLEALQHPALETMSDLLTAESESVRHSTAKDLLDRGPLSRKIQDNRNGQGGPATISLDQAALTAILAGAMNIGHAGILNAFSSLNQTPKDVTPTLGVKPIASSVFPTSDNPALVEPLPDGPSSPPANTWHGKD